jgi:predicted nucleic acid-binding protein
LKAYADSSFIVALYLPQQRSPKAIAFMERYGRSLPFTPWHRLEVRNAIRLAVWRKLIDGPQGKTQLKQLDTDLHEEAVLVPTPVDWTDVLREAEKLGAAHNLAIGCRSADLFHVAASRELGCDTFLTFDDRQAAMAEAAGLTVKP